MSLTRFALTHRSVIYAATALALVGGASLYTSMGRREDPAIIIRSAVVITSWAGAPTRKVEELVTDPLEKKILELEQVKEVRSTSIVGKSIITVDIEDRYVDLDQIWDLLRIKVGETQLPDGVGRPHVNSDFGDVYVTCLALHQVPLEGQAAIEAPYTYRQLEVFCEDLQDQLKTLDAVARVDLYGNQDEVIYLDVDSREWAQIGLTADELARLVDSQNIIEPGGTIDSPSGRYTVTPSGEFNSVSQLGEVIVGTRDGTLPVYLNDVPIQVSRRYEEPARQVARFMTSSQRPERSILLLVSMKEGRNVVELGQQVDTLLTRLETTLLPPDIALTRINEIPRQVNGLIKDFVSNLWQSILIVLAVAFFMMGWRPALVMAAAVPLSMITSIGVVSQLGVELEQFSIASLIIAMGMVVDNAIVVSDNTVRLLKEGKSNFEAAIQGADELTIPVLTSTLTTVAAFGPLAFMEGGSGEYIRSLPIVVSTTLLSSFLIAMCVTPLLCFVLLDAAKADSSPLNAVGRLLARGEAAEGPSRYERLIHGCLTHKALTLGAAFALFLGSLQLIPLIGSQFFPAGLRDQLFLDVWLPEGTSLESTDAVVQQVLDLIDETRTTEVDGQQVDRLANATAFVGGGAPRIMLTMSPEQAFPNYAFLIVNTTNPALSSDWGDELREAVSQIPGARIDVNTFKLGPPLNYPVEFRLYGDDDGVLRGAAEEMLGVLREVPGIASASTDWQNSGYQVSVEIDDDAANLAGVSNRDVARSLNALFSGGLLTTYREGDHLVRVMLRLLSDQQGLETIRGLYVNGQNAKVPLDAIATLTLDWSPARIARVDNRRCITVRSKILPGYLSNSLSQQALPKLGEIVRELPAGYELEVRGEAYETSQSNSKISRAFAIGFCLIILVLVSQYNSFAKPLVILVTVPLALIGALTGLFATGWALGFMPSLGIVSLAGVVINNAIVLIDFIEGRVREGLPLRAAVAQSGAQRMKPILLTTLTTVGGMLPLALFAGPMWAGMAWAVIFGLACSTVLTLLVVPTVYVTMVEVFGMQVEGLATQASPGITATAKLSAPDLPALPADPLPSAPPEDAAPDEPNPEA